MFTQCPACKTIYRLRLEQLKAAQGKVRCSRCHATFDAIDHMVAPPRQACAAAPSPRQTIAESGQTQSLASPAQRTAAQAPASPSVGMPTQRTSNATQGRPHPTHQAQSAAPDTTMARTAAIPPAKPTTRPPETSPMDEALAAATPGPETGVKPGLQGPVRSPHEAEYDEATIDGAAPGFDTAPSWRDDTAPGPERRPFASAASQPASAAAPERHVLAAEPARDANPDAGRQAGWESEIRHDINREAPRVEASSTRAEPPGASLLADDLSDDTPPKAEGPAGHEAASPSAATAEATEASPLSSVLDEILDLAWLNELEQLGPAPAQPSASTGPAQQAVAPPEPEPAPVLEVQPEPEPESKPEQGSAAEPEAASGPELPADDQLDLDFSFAVDRDSPIDDLVETAGTEASQDDVASDDNQQLPASSAESAFRPDASEPIDPTDSPDPFAESDNVADAGTARHDDDGQIDPQASSEALSIDSLELPGLDDEEAPRHSIAAKPEVDAGRLSSATLLEDKFALADSLGREHDERQPPFDHAPQPIPAELDASPPLASSPRSKAPPPQRAQQRAGQAQDTSRPDTAPTADDEFYTELLEMFNRKEGDAVTSEPLLPHSTPMDDGAAEQADPPESRHDPLALNTETQRGADEELSAAGGDETAASAQALIQDEQATRTRVAPEKAAPSPAIPPPPSYALAPEELTTTRGSHRGLLLWATGSLLLLLALAVQIVYQHQGSFANHAMLRPVLALLCQIGDCEVPPQRDVMQIRLASHLVQAHPRYQDSLLITATLINRAAYPQPYPVIELQMTDLQQRLVAARRFRPEEYLVGQRSDRPMPVNIEVPMMLEVLDPGREVLGFRFEFH